MTKVEVYAGSCGHSATVEVNRLDGKHVEVVIHSECEQITAMNPDLACLQWQGKGHEVFKPMAESAVYQSASRHIRHTGCPIPAAILKAIEVEVGVALPEDVSMRFVAAHREDSRERTLAAGHPPGAGRPESATPPQKSPEG